MAAIAPAITWQQELARAYTQVSDLLHALDLDNQLAEIPQPVLRGFPLRVPRAYVARMRPGDPHDPLLRQVLPLALEADSVPGFVADPVGDLASIRAPGLLQKYHGRALVVTTGACGIHCRYCFRREFPYQQHQAGGSQAATILTAIQRDTSLTEVILSGGDPLSLSNARLGGWLEQLARMHHVTRLRIHTRLPVVLPKRVDGGLLAALKQWPRQLVVVLHVNHAQEIDQEVATVCGDLAATGAALLNQSVLLRGVNDSVATLRELSEVLFCAGVLPYYLHQLDPVAGAAHFAVSDDRARLLLSNAAAGLPGYLVPRLVRELPGATAKTPVGQPVT
ncbi:MAG: EF-P beta-lysylation protein EpmB [Gammaproteobacteria bacterium]|nr:EF-P beta-lysylation protein EpmB [Gammaproteobacteria bacterium]